ncbi:chemotaxis protein CheC [Archaeoglobus veneficus]|uniref:CheC, inhibitor of MCP methylation n=1 Tax=Archaeoglobus veneficus (strain DSM 11195 / SNP6) TaxID=693661 RepID=F2KP63_ARCVS|nr:chemotaxis protein CheC [Archaeoglobus veneficus]AEA47467.1 CheC, inhibitor of MCP methylation [Archaeoglobus veneficus SNP6]
MKVDLYKLAKMNEMAKEGARRVAENLSAMLGMDVQMKITKIDFVTLSDIPEEIGDEEMVGVYLMFHGTPSGHLMVLFPVASAKKVASLLLAGIGEDNGTGEGFTDLDKSAISEVGNIITSSFIDGWANVLKTEIDISTPHLIHDMGSAVIDPIIVELAKEHDHAFVFNSSITAQDKDITCQIYVFPDMNKLVEALERL